MMKLKLLNLSPSKKRKLLKSFYTAPQKGPFKKQIIKILPTDRISKTTLNYKRIKKIIVVLRLEAFDEFCETDQEAH